MYYNLNLLDQLHKSLKYCFIKQLKIKLTEHKACTNFRTIVIYSVINLTLKYNKYNVMDVHIEIKC